MDMEEMVKEMEEKANVYHYLGKKDSHLVRVLHWIEILGDLSKECMECDQDEELCEELRAIIARLVREAGIRLSLIIP